MLVHSIRLLHNKGIDKYKREYVCRAITSGYFKVPQFRSILLEAIEIKNKDTTSGGAEDIQDASKHLVVDDMVASCLLKINEEERTDDYFDWNKLCFNFIDQREAEANRKIIESIIEEKKANLKWAERIRRRGQSFFMIIQAWVRHVRRVLFNEKGITWADIPGYKVILTALFEEMKTRYINQYPDALVEAVTSFLSNSKVFNIAIRISFSKTSLYDTAAVRKTMQMTA